MTMTICGRCRNRVTFTDPPLCAACRDEDRERETKSKTKTNPKPKGGDR